MANLVNIYKQIKLEGGWIDYDDVDLKCMTPCAGSHLLYRGGSLTKILPMSQNAPTLKVMLGSMRFFWFCFFALIIAPPRGHSRK